MGVGSPHPPHYLDAGKGRRMTGRDDRLLRATTVAVAGRRPRTVDERRVCPIEGCDTVLSRYNSGETCLPHQPTRFPRVRGGSPLETS